MTRSRIAHITREGDATYVDFDDASTLILSPHGYECSADGAADCEHFDIALSELDEEVWP